MPDKRLRPSPPPVPAEQLKLLATPRDELEKQTSVYSFDYDRFLERIGSGERWQTLLQAHLYFDHVITLVLTEALQRPEELDVRRMGFSQKLQLISAMDLLSRDLLPAIGRINDLRNKIAHDLSFEVSDKDERDLRNCLPKYFSDFILEHASRDAPGPPRFDEIIDLLLLMVEFGRQSNALNRLLELKTAVRLRTKLERTPGAVYVE